MWSDNILSHLSIHYIWLSAFITQFLVTLCGKRSNSTNNKKPSAETAVSKATTGSSDTKVTRAAGSTENFATSGEAMVHQTQPSAEPAEEPPPGYDMKNVQKFHDEQKSEKTDLRSVQDLKFAYNPKNPLGDVKKPKNAGQRAASGESANKAQGPTPVPQSAYFSSAVPATGPTTAANPPPWMASKERHRKSFDARTAAPAKM
ncbi:hypothetical protein Q1695_008009 [Nippostrongylus brasiliensis]|nr:hypothetical protein Q1695_008009 [Nippostrongylus brasiliensis]